MYEHFILLHSDYTEGKRIALHQVSTNISELKNFNKLMNDLKSTYPDISFGFHHLKTDEKTWESVVAYDKFFDDVFPVSNIDSFIRFLADDGELTSLDIANLISSKIECTHLKLQKLLYFFYVNYIKQYGKAPFQEKFVAWKYGPVIKEVYDTYKKYSDNNIDDFAEDNNVAINQDATFKLSVYSRFKQVSNLNKYLTVIDETLHMYKDRSPWELVDLTHQPGEPWAIVTKGGKHLNKIISEDLIKESLNT